ncbi:MAG: hypothetical protein QOD00_251, partial [Blastocatellia bacterium]|nr:hypothetical protein [Blastocatellia bacterium]
MASLARQLSLLLRFGAVAVVVEARGAFTAAQWVRVRVGSGEDAEPDERVPV